MGYISQEIMASLNGTITTLVVQAVKSCLPAVVMAAAESALPAAIGLSVEKIMKPISDQIQKAEKRLLALETECSARDVEPNHTNTQAAGSYAAAVKTPTLHSVKSTILAKLAANAGDLTRRGMVTAGRGPGLEAKYQKSQFWPYFVQLAE